MTPRLIEVRKNVLKKNDELARSLRDRFHQAEVRVAEWHPPLGKIRYDVVGESKELHQQVTTGSIGSMLARFGSSHGGSLSARPSDDTSSSTVNPGAIVATSNSTPPGSRK